MYKYNRTFELNLLFNRYEYYISTYMSFSRIPKDENPLNHFNFLYNAR